MLWDIAGGVIIGSAVVGLFRWAGEGDPDFDTSDPDRVKANLVFRGLLASAGLALAIWIIGFKAHLS